MNTIEAQILQRKLYAEYWLAMATTGTAKERKVYKSVDAIGDTELTDKEKVSRALSIALSHIQLMDVLIEKYMSESNNSGAYNSRGEPSKAISYCVNCERYSPH